MPIGVDIGGSSIRAARVSAEGEILAHARAALPDGGAPDAVAATLMELSARLQATDEPGPVGVSLPGRLDGARRRLVRALNLPALEGVDLVELLTRRLGREAILIPDCSAAAFAQWRTTAPAAERFVYLTIGTGVGGSAIIGGRICDGTTGSVAHYGHLIVDATDAAPVCACGARGCLEACVAGLALKGGFTPWAAQRLALGLVQLAHLWTPNVICLGGGVIDHEPRAIELARECFVQRVGRLASAPELLRGRLRSDEAGVIGAGLLSTGVLVE